MAEPVEMSLVMQMGSRSDPWGKGHFRGGRACVLPIVSFRDRADLGVRRRCSLLPNYFGHLLV